MMPLLLAAAVAMDVIPVVGAAVLLATAVVYIYHDIKLIQQAYGNEAQKAAEELDKTLNETKILDLSPSDPPQNQKKAVNVSAHKNKVAIKIFDPLTKLINEMKTAQQYAGILTDRERRMEYFRHYYHLPDDARFATKLCIGLFVSKESIKNLKINLSNAYCIVLYYYDFFINSISIGATEYIQACQSYDDIYFIFHGHSAESISVGGYLVEPIGLYTQKSEELGQFSLFNQLYYSILSGSSLNEFMKLYENSIASVALDLGNRKIYGALGNFTATTDASSQHVYRFGFTFIPFVTIYPQKKWENILEINPILAKDAKDIPTAKEVETVKKMLRTLLKIEPNISIDEKGNINAKLVAK
jgi:hypothetical protein